MNAIAISAITAYRRFLSPHKGFCCAHHALYRSGSCSDFGLKIFERRNFILAMKMLRHRLAACKAASVSLARAPARQAVFSEHEDDDKPQANTAPRTRGSSIMDGCADGATQAACESCGGPAADGCASASCSW